MHNHRIAGSFAGSLTGSLTLWLRRALFALALALTACGGGGSGGSSSTASSSGGTTGSSPQSSPTQSGVSNAVTVTVAQGVEGAWNIPTVSVTVCAPGTSNCQTIDNVQVDTGSFGLRLLSSALSSSVAAALPTSSAGSGATLAECASFADGYMWGSVHTADVKLGGETASAIPIQVVGDLSSSTVPAACQRLGSDETTQEDVGANGILGIGVAPNDCGPTCTPAADGYYACPNGANCTGITVTATQEVANPVANFAADNNGVSLQLPAVASTGAPSATGTLLFGIGTETNNAMSATQRFETSDSGDLTATFNGAVVPYAFLDSGSNGLFFADSAIPQCTNLGGGWYCPTSTDTLGATLTGVDGSTGSISFDVANAQTLYNTGNLALNDLGGSICSSGQSCYAQDFDLGLPFFYGRTVYYGYDQRAAGGQAPYVAF